MHTAKKRCEKCRTIVTSEVNGLFFKGVIIVKRRAETHPSSSVVIRHCRQINIANNFSILFEISKRIVKFM